MSHRTPPTRISRRRTAVYAALTATMLGAGLVTGAASAAAPSPACTITGTPGNDTLRGTARADVICGLGGNDVLIGNGGNDVLNGGAGNDRIDAGAGNDTVDAGTGNDTVSGGSGADILRGGDGNDTVNGDAGNDVLGGDKGSDRLGGGAGANTCAPGDAASNCVMDMAGPTISNLRFPATAKPGENVTFTWRAQDASGVSYGDVRIGGYQGLAGWCFAVPAVLISGDVRDGEWSATCQVPVETINDTLGVQIFALDSLGTAPAAPVTGSLEVVDASNDLDAPTSSELVVPATAPRGQSAVVTVRLQEATGVKFANVILRAPDGIGFIWGADFARISGDERDGVYQITAAVPADAALGDYKVWLWTGDVLNNRTVQMDAGTVTVTE